MSKIVLENVTKRFGKTVAVDNLSLEIPDGEFFSLLGPSGCGKTTTMRIIAGLERPDEGRIWIGDQLVCDAADGMFVPPGRRGLGMVFQNYALWPHMTVAENILFGLKVRKLGAVERSERLERGAQRLQISELVDRYPNELSGGQQQRVALARELVTGTHVLLMDEPLSNLDAKLRIDMRVELKLLHEETRASVVYVTHDQIEALTLSTQMAVMRDGLLQQVGDPMEVFSNPRNLFVARFMGHNPINEIVATVEKEELHFGSSILPFPQDLLPDVEQLVLASRPEDLRITTTRNEWSLPVVVESVLPMGYESLVYAAVCPVGSQPTRESVRITVSVDERDRKVHEHDSCFIEYDPSSLMLFDPSNGARVRTTGV